MREKKLLTSRQIFRYAVPARTVTKKHWMYENTVDAVALCFVSVFFAKVRLRRHQAEVQRMHFGKTW